MCSRLSPNRASLIRLLENMGLVADGWPYYSASGDILPGVDHPFEFPDEARKIKGGEIVEY